MLLSVVGRLPGTGMGGVAFSQGIQFPSKCTCDGAAVLVDV